MTVNIYITSKAQALTSLHEWQPQHGGGSWGSWPGIGLLVAGWWKDVEHSKERARSTGVTRPPREALGSSCLPVLWKYFSSSVAAVNQCPAG